MIRQKIIIINGFSEAMLRNNFTSAELKDVRGLPLKLHFLLIKCGTVFILQQKNPC